MRRTTTHDSVRPDGLLGVLVVEAHGRDLLTGADASTSVVAEAAVRARIDYVPHRIVTHLATEPDAPALGALAGTPASSGFRARIDEALPEERTSHSLRYQLLDDLPTAVLVSGYAIGAGGATFQRPGDLRALQHADLCAGWATGATILVEMDRLGSPPVVTGPAAPDLRAVDDPLAWHDGIADLPAHGMRRRRLLDVWREDGEIAVECFFRDSHWDALGAETVIHEYSIQASVSPDGLEFGRCVASVGALPWVECPAAAASAERLVGTPVGDLRLRVRQDFVGPTTCTHLNDTLRSLEDVASLAARLVDV